MRVLNFIAALLLGGLLLTAPASANPLLMRATIEGVVGPNIGYDKTGVFGTPEVDLLGASFLLSLTYDLSLGQRTTVAGSSDELIGGPALGLSDPLVDIALTVNGTTAHIATGGHVILSTASGGFDFYAASPASSLQMNHVIMFLGSPYFLPSLDTDYGPFPVTGGEDFQIRTDFATGGGSDPFAVGQLVGTSFKLEHVDGTVSEPSALLCCLTALLFVMARERRRVGRQYAGLSA